MSDPALPDGFRWEWSAGSLLVRLPELLSSGSGHLEPVLSRVDARRLADAVEQQHSVRGRRRSTSGAPPRIVLSHDALYSHAAVLEFRERLAEQLAERGLNPHVATTVERKLDTAPEEVDPGGDTDALDLDLDALS